MAMEEQVVREDATKIGRPTEADLDDIMRLQAANQPKHGGTLSADFSRSQIAAMMREMP